MKVLLLPINISSDLSHKVRALKSIGLDARGLALGGHTIQDAKDIEIFELQPGRYLRNRINRIRFYKRMNELIQWADVVHWLWDFGSMPFRLDKRLVQRSKKPGVIQWGGSDIRIPEIDFDINPYYKEAFFSGYEYKTESRSRSMRDQTDFADVGFFPVEFIGMGHYINKDLFPLRFRIWQSVVLSEHPPRFPEIATKRPLLLHSPSAPVCKGTSFILSAVEELKLKYDFDFTLVQGMARGEAMQLMQRCDVYIDQLIIGMHGSAAVEAMAFGKPVVCYIDPVIGKDYPEDLPIVSANPENIYEKLEELIRDSVVRNELGRKGRSYVEKYHDDRKIAHELMDIYSKVIELRQGLEPQLMSSISSLKKLAGDSLVYGISGILSRFLSAFLVPIYTRVFLPSDYGVISLVINFFALLNIVVVLGLDYSVARWYWDTDNDIDRRITLNTFLWGCFSGALIIAIVILLFSNQIAVRILKEPSATIGLRIAAVNLPLTIFTVFTWNLLRMQRRPVATTVFTLTTSLITIGLNFLFVVGLRIGISGIFYAQLITSVVAVTWTFILFRREIELPRINWRRLSEMIRFSLPLVPGSIAFWVVNLSAAYFIKASWDTGEVGLYQIGATVASGMAMVTGAFQMAWGPFAYSIHKEPGSGQVYADTLLAYMGVTCGLSLLITVFSRQILLIFTTQDYVSSFWVAGILSYNFVLVGLSYIASIGTGLAKNNYAFGISMIVSAGLLVALCLGLVPAYGKEGAAIATVSAQMIVPIAVFWHGQKLYPIPYNFIKAALIFVGSMALAFGTLAFSTQVTLTPALDIAVKLAAVFVYALGTALLFRRELWQLKYKLDSLLRRRTDAII